MLPYVDAYMPTLHPANGQQVEEGGLCPAEGAIFRGAVQTRTVVDLHLRHAGAFHLHQSGKKAVHPGEHGQPAREFRAHDLQRTAGILDGLMAETVADGIGYLRGDTLGEGVLPPRTPADDHIEAAFVFAQHGGNVRGVVLKVGVYGDDHITLGVAETGAEGRGLPAVAAERDVTRFGVFGSETLDDVEAAVGAAVVDEEHFPRFAKPGYGLVNLGEKDGEVVFLVEDRHDDGERSDRVHGSVTYGKRSLL